MAGKVGGLGRGLDALFADRVSIEEDKKTKEDIIEKNENVDEPAGEKVQYIDINNIKPNANQPRKIFNEEKIQELASSIKEHGVIQPLVLRKNKNGYEIVAGERRWRAARTAGIKKIPCIIRDFSDEENMLVAIIENMQREDLNPIEEAEGLQQMVKVYGFTQEEVSKSVSKSRPYITNALRLLKLPEEIQNLVSNGKISTGHGRALVSLNNRDLQNELCKRIVEKGMTVRELEKLISQLDKPKKKQKKEKSHDIIFAENQLKDKLGTKINIEKKGKKGKIEIEFYSNDELNRIIDLINSIN